MEETAVIAYGEGGKLGSFKPFAETLKRDLSKKYTTVLMQYVNRDHKLFSLIDSIGPKQKIAELHIFAHSMGAGIFLGYGEPMIAAERTRLINNANIRGRHVDYFEAVKAEIGAIQTDDFKVGSLVERQTNLRSRF